MAEEINVSTPETTNPEGPSPRYTEEELQSHISQAVNAAVAKAKAKATKSSEERITELEAELARRDNIEATRKAMKSSSIPEALESLFVGDNYEDKINTFNEWYGAHIDDKVKEVISSASPLHLKNEAPITHKRQSLDTINSQLLNERS